MHSVRRTYARIAENLSILRKCQSSASNAYVYDIENRLVSASGATSASLRYDPLGRLYEVAGASGTTRFLYDGDELVAEYNGSGTMLRRYAHGSNIDDPVVWYEGSSIGPARWLHSDHQGSVVAITDSTGAAIAINRYDEWGIPGTTNMGRFQYTGQAWIPDLGLYHYKARIYSPTLGRFLQTDPIGYDDQINLYAYVANDPVNNTDPDGMCTGSLIANKDGTCKGASLVNPGLKGAGTSDGAVPGNAQAARSSTASAPPGRGGTFVPPTNPPAEPPITGQSSPASRGGGLIGQGPNGSTIRIQPASQATTARGYPNGYWVMTKNGNPINPSTGKPPGPGNISSGQSAAQTHVPLPEDSKYNTTSNGTSARGFLGFLGRLGSLIGCIIFCESPAY